VTLAAGNVVIMKMQVFMDGTGGTWNADGDICKANSLFELVTDSQTCENTDESTSMLPFVVELQHPITFDEYQTMKANKRGYVRLMDNNYWIREVKYVPQKLSTLTLLGANSICGTD
jgi:hypothetical protein